MKENEIDSLVPNKSLNKRQLKNSENTITQSDVLQFEKILLHKCEQLAGERRKAYLTKTNKMIHNKLIWIFLLLQIFNTSDKD